MLNRIKRFFAELELLHYGILMSGATQKERIKWQTKRTVYRFAKIGGNKNGRKDVERNP